VSAQPRPADETDALIRSLASSTSAITEFSRQRQQQFDAGYRDLLAVQLEIERDQSSPSREVAELRQLLTELKAQKEAQSERIEAKIKEIQGIAQALAQQQQKLATTLRKMNEILPKLLDAISQNQDAEKAQLTLTAISRDRDEVALLLAAIKSNNRGDATTVITRGLSAGLQSGNRVAGTWTGVGTAPGSTPVALLATQSAGGARITFRLGTLTHCVGVQNVCNGRPYTISR
jgi:septal ring factor EnvC (AmiA/AmiB activator)